jgi:hypothetical protein
MFRYTNFWFDIARDFDQAQLELMLGGEVAMWTDNYCYIFECIGDGQPDPVAAVMYNSTYDAQFAKSVSGIMWPRAYVGAAVFWNYLTDLDPYDINFLNGWLAFNDVMISRGVAACPSGCYCDELTACGTPYIQS